MNERKGVIALMRYKYWGVINKGNIYIYIYCINMSKCTVNICIYTVPVHSQFSKDLLMSCIPLINIDLIYHNLSLDRRFFFSLS